jgi:very-short-patch-repair endonuclease
VVHDLRSLLGPTGVVRTKDLRGRVDRHTLARWVAAGRLIRPHPGVLVLPERIDDWRVRALAGVVATDGVLSHVSALTVWRLAPSEGPVHLSVRAARRAVRSPGLVVHRVQRLDADRIGGLPVTDLDRALIDTWGLALGASGRPRLVELARSAVISTLRERRLKPTALREALAGRPGLPGRRALAQLIDLVEQGCHSELEIWGVRDVLTGPGMPRFVQQHPVRLPYGTVVLDAALPELRIAIELDGAAFHGSREARERDTRRDVALAALGWVVLRFSYRRLVTEPDACRREILQVCAARRALFARG